MGWRTIALVLVLATGALQPVGPQPAEAATAVLTSVPAATPVAAGPELPSPAVFLDAAWYRDQLIHTTDLWNGGLDGQSGFGAYRSDFDGLFHVNLDRQWHTLPMSTSTAVAQSRAIFLNVEAYRAAGPAQGQRFLKAVTQGTDYLLAHFHDPQYGGYYWGVGPEGAVTDNQKQGYGNTFPLLAFSQAYSVTAKTEYLQAARDQLAVLRAHFLDPNFACGLRWTLTRNFTQPSGDNNLGNWIHLFEALQSYYDVTSGTERADVAGLIQACGDFVTGQLYKDQPGHPERGYLAGTYDAQWRPSGNAAEPGHMLELSYLLSRAVERGFTAGWLDTAHKMVNFAMAYARDPTYHALQYYVIGFDGQPVPGNPDNAFFTWWPQTETARALLHFAIVRGWDTAGEFKAEEDFIHRYQTDQEYRGLWERVAPDAQGALVPDRLDKGHIWKSGYHYAAFFGEVLRLSALYPARLQALNPHPAYLPLLIH
jgi:cellobiose epimerase